MIYLKFKSGFVRFFKNWSKYKIHKIQCKSGTCRALSIAFLLALGFNINVVIITLKILILKILYNHLCIAIVIVILVKNLTKILLIIILPKLFFIFYCIVIFVYGIETKFILY